MISFIFVRRDHPRSRGVYYTVYPVGLSYMGSSPLARGLRERTARLRRIGGIIPARAGFTTFDAASEKIKRDHPRSRGVYKIKSLTDENSGGSSPLARGLLPEERPLDSWSPDHPRSRGVYASGVGSWGRMWGIIPARAGFTRCGR